QPGATVRAAHTAVEQECDRVQQGGGNDKQMTPRVQRVPRATPNQTPHAELAESADKAFRAFSAFRVQPRIKRRTPNSRNPQTKYSAGSARSACNPESNAARRTRGIRRQSIPRVQRAPRATPNQTAAPQIAGTTGQSMPRFQPIPLPTPNQTPHDIPRKRIRRLHHFPPPTPTQPPHAELAESADKVFRGFSPSRVQPRTKRRTPNSRNPQTKYSAGSARSACNPESNAARRTRG